VKYGIGTPTFTLSLLRPESRGVSCLHFSVVEGSYSGPRLDSDISEEFMRDVLQCFNNQKKLHKKYVYKVRQQSRVR